MQVKVWNDNIYPLKQYFKGNHVTIPAKSFIEMEFYEAHEFAGTYHHIEYDAAGQQDPKSYKMVRIEREQAVLAMQDKLRKHICIACAHESPSKEELKAHIDTKHANDPRLKMEEVDEYLRAQPVDQDALKKELRESLKAELMSELKAELLADKPSAKKNKEKAVN